jgi:DNA-binding NarL/FixJ family response regulator
MQVPVSERAAATRLDRREQAISTGLARPLGGVRLRVLLYEPAPLFAEALAALLGTQPDIEAIGTSDLAEFLAGVPGASLAVVCFRAWAPQVATVLRCVRARSNAPLMLLGQDDPPPSLARTVGTSVHVGEAATTAVFLDAIRKACDGDRANELREGRSEDGRERVSDVLTPREREVISLIAEDLTSRQVATLLRVSERTIHSHLRNAYKKLGVHGRIGAIEAARRAGLLSRPLVAVCGVSSPHEGYEPPRGDPAPASGLSGNATLEPTLR